MIGWAIVLTLGVWSATVVVLGVRRDLMPYNYGDTRLANIPIETARIRPWTVAVRVTRADPQFAGVSSEVKLWRDREDLGMGPAHVCADCPRRHVSALSGLLFVRARAARADAAAHRIADHHPWLLRFVHGRIAGAACGERVTGAAKSLSCNVARAET
jgi:hypothetical protein